MLTGASGVQTLQVKNDRREVVRLERKGHEKVATTTKSRCHMKSNMACGQCGIIRNLPPNVLHYGAQRTVPIYASLCRVL